MREKVFYQSLTFSCYSLVHGWNYRRFVVGHLRGITENEQQIAKIVEQEYEFTTRKINQSFSNYSAWHQRSKLLPEIVASMSEEGKNIVATNELDLVKAAIYTDPEDQSAWLYYWWLLGRAPEEVELFGAYQLQDTPLIFLGFNDVIKFMQLPRLFDKNDQLLLGKLYSLNQQQESSSIWVFVLDNNDQAVKNVIIQSDTILPSNSSKTIPQDKTWNLDIVQVTRDEGKDTMVKSVYYISMLTIYNN